MISVRTLSSGRFRLLLSVVLAGLALFALGLHSTASRKPVPPPLPIVSNCKPLPKGLRRLGGEFGFQLDVVPADFQVLDGTQDAPPFAHGYSLRRLNSDSPMNISYDDDEFKSTDPLLVFSERFEKRLIRDDTGAVVGHEYWGYLDKQKIWRRIHFRGRVDIGYDRVSASQAAVFDKVVSSACFLPAREGYFGQ